MPDQADKALIALRQILLATDKSMSEIAKRSGLPPAQMLVLKTLRSIGEVRTGDLARKLSIKPATISVLLDRLELSGLDHRAIILQHNLRP